MKVRTFNWFQVHVYMSQKQMSPKIENGKNWFCLQCLALITKATFFNLDQGCPKGSKLETVSARMEKYNCVVRVESKNAKIMTLLIIKQ